MPAGLYFRHPSSLEHETGAHPENKARIPAIEQELERRDWLGWERREAPAVELSQLERIHPAEHIEHIRATVAAGGGWFDADTLASPGSWEAALHAAGGACAVVDAVMSGEAPTAFAGLRPPGHHCETARPMGFCLFNNVAVAAQHALDSHGVERVAVFDWDVHHGNGTNDIFHARRDVLYVSIHQSPLYPGTGPLRDIGSGDAEGYTVNLPVPPGAGEPIWLSLVEHIVMQVLRSFEPGLILVSAGFDAHRADPLAQCTLQTESFAKMATHVVATARSLGVPFGALLEGGYDLDALAASVAATLEAFGRDDAEPESFERDEITERTSAVVREHWPVS
ncbi:MAG TPA: histone deacetylase [Thermoleophilaceae bacterium]|jgi:acetoin utilization deacetylase AcuC-like enzyme|nr:histone deacetylase [Thermoleophilaceae bacterium]